MDICQLPNILFLSACDILAIDTSLAPVTLVLAEDGTIVDDDDYFLCLPANTKFVVLAGNEKWTYNSGKKCWPYIQYTLHHDVLSYTRHLVAVWLFQHLCSKHYWAPSVCQSDTESGDEDEWDAVRSQVTHGPTATKTQQGRGMWATDRVRLSGLNPSSAI